MTGFSTNLLLSLVVVGAGVSVALQQILNANLRSSIGSPWWAGFVSFLVGTVVMLIAGLATGLPGVTAPVLARTPWLSWTGGAFGAIFIATVIFMLPRFGAATTLALGVVGQMVGSLSFDHFGLFGLAQHSVTPIRVLGAAFLIAGVLLVRR